MLDFLNSIDILNRGQPLATMKSGNTSGFIHPFSDRMYRSRVDVASPPPYTFLCDGGGKRKGSVRL